MSTVAAQPSPFSRRLVSESGVAGASRFQAAAWEATTQDISSPRTRKSSYDDVSSQVVVRKTVTRPADRSMPSPRQSSGIAHGGGVRDA
ncbi:hypothetical protein ISF_03129 [Cordyceps fumosorosea ARSEF 2679]|uniref:Uncharacterized protein n=1 Tax=Cordyceps fumosorosea (strain ARSEF 2679) TaxID=1081104 RepID=A0A162MT07_CORFA|nr:hypothetical protein ISF_03129 [Cordyceps fumosorosea ARSEF 2679]OAA69859.1 hypothetical protein ISF_03129 [Cordyceps fumosorosea ARSEF 2679]